MDSGIYIITCTANGKVYVGSSRNIKKRLWNHKTFLNRGNHDNEHLQNAWNKYGDKSFTFNRLERMETQDRKELENREIYWINRYESTDKEKGFNKCLPGEITFEAKEKQKKSNERKEVGVYSISLETGEATFYRSTNLLCTSLDIPAKVIEDRTAYWRGRKWSQRSCKGYLFVRASDYNEEFDYVNYKKVRIYKSRPGPKTVIVSTSVDI